MSCVRLCETHDELFAGRNEESREILRLSEERLEWLPEGSSHRLAPVQKTRAKLSRSRERRHLSSIRLPFLPHTLHSQYPEQLQMAEVYSERFKVSSSPFFNTLRLIPIVVD